MSEIAEEALQRDILFFCGKHVQRREIARTEVRRMRHAGRAIGFGALADLPLRRQTILDRARLQMVDAGREARQGSC